MECVILNIERQFLSSDLAIRTNGMNTLPKNTQSKYTRGRGNAN